MRALRLARPLAARSPSLRSCPRRSALGQPPARGAKHEAAHAWPVPTTMPGSARSHRLSRRANSRSSGGTPVHETHRTRPGGPGDAHADDDNRGETLSIAACGDDGGFSSIDLDRVAHLLRAATGDEHPRRSTHAARWSIASRRTSRCPRSDVVSGYRVPKPGSHSNHGKGRAMDMVVPGVADEEVARFAREMGFVGVGVYPTSQFVHVDVRPRSYFWVDFSGPHMKNRERGILGELAAKSDAAAVARGQALIEPYAVMTDVDAALRARGVSGSASAVEEDEDDEN